MGNVEPKKVELMDEYVAVRFRPPSQFVEFRTPDWAAHAATEILDEWRMVEDEEALYHHPKTPPHNQIEITMGKTEAGNWFIQRILYPMHNYPDVLETGYIDKDLLEDIISSAEFIQNKIEREGSFAPVEN